MPYALQRRLARLFPQGSSTPWLDCRGGFSPVGKPFPVAIIGLDFMAASDAYALLPAAALVLDMDGGAGMEDVIRTGADGMLCSPAQPWERLAAIALQGRSWRYPFIADCRKATPQAVQRLFSLGAHAALLDQRQARQSPFKTCTTRVFAGGAANVHQ